ncbi:MAG: SusC/RagA family TonB-linked outer membrane protein [Muribaculum sp.]|nr:SusC/RagA family TonB-linked outer membrane protein [Muribaculum sp.]
MKKVLMVLILAVSMLIPLECYARTYNAQFDKANPEEVIKTLKQETGLEFVYKKDILKHAKSPVTCNYTGLTLDQLLNRVISINMFLDYEVVDKSVILKTPNMNVDYVQGTIKGIVYDLEENEPLAGATIMVDGTTNVTVSDIDGHFTIKDVNALNPIVTCLFVGMKPASVKVTPKNQNNIRFDLETHATMMSEVVVTGYADVSKEKMTGATATISADKLDERYTLNLLDNLEGRVAGLSTYGGKPIIRGVGTLNGSTSPLLVVDGLPIEGDIEDLNPYDIESVNVLKDAAASAIYGACAANGIIVVTTKSAKKKGKIDIDFSANLTWYEKKNMDYHDNFYMNPEEQIAAESNWLEYYFFTEDGNKNNPTTNIMMEQMYIDGGYLNPTPLEYAYLQLASGQITRDELNRQIEQFKGNNYAQEYADALYRRQVIQQYNLALRSASENSRNNIVINYKKDNSGIINHKYDWLNISYKGSYDVAKWLTATLSINSIISDSREFGNDYSTCSSSPWKFTSYMPFYNEDGTRYRNYGWYCGNRFTLEAPAFHDLGEDPVEEMYNNTLTTHRQDMRYHADLLFKIIPGLTANAQFIYETTMTNSKQYANEQSHASRVLRNAFTVSDGKGGYKYLTPESGGFLQTTQRNGNYWTARGQLNYSRTFGKHDIAAIAGFEFRETKIKGTKALALGYDEQLQSSSTHTIDFGTLSLMNYNPDYMSFMGGFPSNQFAFVPYLQDGMGIVPEVHHRYGSGYANATYTYDEKYNIFGSFRKDYADVFGLNSEFRGKPLWSVGAGWNIHNEEFAREFTPWLSFLKLRFSYGVTGNIFQGATSVMTASAGDINEYTNQPFGSVTSPANPDLRWEQNRTTNVGLDFSFFNYRLRGSFDFYNKVGKDIFNNLNLDPTSGFSSIVANAASIKNTGIELVASYDWFIPRARRDFSWTTSMTFSYNKNEVTDVENDATRAYQLISTPYKVGYPVNALWSYRFAGISDIEGQQGMTLFYDENGGKTTTVSNRSVECLEFSGQSDPKYIIGMDNTWKWNGISLGVVLAYYGGHKMRALPFAETFAGSYSAPMKLYFKDSWTPDNQTDIPGKDQYATISSSSQTTYANRSVHDASFLKIRNITLGYTVPEAWTRRFGVNLMTFRFQVTNPKAIWTANDLGVDPETLGIRNPSSYMVGLNLNL